MGPLGRRRRRTAFFPERLSVFVGVVVALGSAALVAAVVETALEPARILALLFVAAMLAELLEVASDDASPHAIDTQRFSFSSSVHVAALLLVGPWGAAVVAAVGVVVIDALRRRAHRQIAFNVSAFALSTLAAGAAFNALGGSPGSLAMPDDLAAVAGLVTAYAVVNTTLVGTVVALARNARVRALIRETAEAEMPTVTAEASLGVAIAFFTFASPWYTVLLLPLLLAVYQSHARLAQMRRETSRALETFANVVDERDRYTFRHSERVAEYARQLADRLGCSASDASRLRWAGRLHDLGKIAVDPHILSKPARLDQREWEAIRRHPRLSARLLRRFRFAHDEAKAVEYHHERFDGGGYYGIDGAQVPLAAHFLIVADTYDAMTSDRPYRPALAPDAALREIENGLGTQFHPVVGKAFVALQRGLDPKDSLTRAERDELRTLFGGRQRLRQQLRKIPPAPDAVVVVSFAASCVLFALATPLFGFGALACAAAGGVWRWFRVRRAVALADALAATRDASPAEHLAALGRRLHEAAPIDWAGLLHWQEDSLTASMIAGWGNAFAAPSEAALTSWLVRDLTPEREILVADGAEVGRGGALYAIPVGDPAGQSGFLVLLFPSAPVAHVDSAIRFAAESLRIMFAPRDERPSIHVVAVTQ